MTPCELVGVTVAAYQVEPSSEHSQVAVLSQFPLTTERNCVVASLTHAANALGAGSTPNSPATNARPNHILVH